MTSSSDGLVKLICVVGARPNFMKIAPLMRVFASRSDRFQAVLLHTGQHYDEAMKDAFFRQLGIPEPDIDLEVGSATHAVQTANIMRLFEPVLEQEMPDAVLVVGDVNSTIACALVAVKRQVPVIHVEAGLRSFDRSMPEEINRILTDRISELLFTTEPEGAANLAAEGAPNQSVHFVGNVMIDTLMNNLESAVPARTTFKRLAHPQWFLESSAGFGVLTLHRPSNVDCPSTLGRLIRTLSELSTEVPLVFPVHPRTRARIERAGLESAMATSHIEMTAPLGYQELLGLMREARLVLTDSGGIQEETTALGIPCLTLRENTERPITVSEGTNTVVGADPAKIRREFAKILSTGGKHGRIPQLWDGKAAERIADVIDRWMERRRQEAA